MNRAFNHRPHRAVSMVLCGCVLLGILPLGHAQLSDVRKKQLLELQTEAEKLLIEFGKLPKGYADRGSTERFLEYKAKAEKGEVLAQSLLGLCYYNGEGVEIDYGEAVKWFRKAAEQNYDEAQNNLGHCYANGTGVDKDYTEAVKWFRKSAEQNDAKAQCNLGISYKLGKGVQKDFAEAVKLFRKSAEQDCAEAQKNLGLSYADGQGVEKDLVEAYAWLNLVARTEADAAKHRDALEEKMSTQEVVDAQKRTKELRAQINAKFKKQGK